MGMTKDVFDEYGNYKYPDYSNLQYTHNVSTTGETIMEMPITEALKWLENGYKDDKQDKSLDPKWAVALKCTIGIIHKYQKIEKIITDWKSDGGAMQMSDKYWLGKIEGVLEKWE